MTEEFECPVCGNELVKCPNCGKIVVHRAAVRQGTVMRPDIGEVGLIDIGWKCEKCRHEWGFEVLTDERLEAQARRDKGEGSQTET